MPTVEASAPKPPHQVASKPLPVDSPPVSPEPPIQQSQPSSVASAHIPAFAALPEEMRIRAASLPEREARQLATRLETWKLAGVAPTDKQVAKVEAFLQSLEIMARPVVAATPTAPVAPPQGPSITVPECIVVEGEEFVQESAVDDLLNAYEALPDPARRDMDSQMVVQKIMWSVPMDVPTFTALRSLILSRVPAPA